LNRTEDSVKSFEVVKNKVMEACFAAVSPSNYTLLNAVQQVN
jgi:hypothetical protein